MYKERLGVEMFKIIKGITLTDFHLLIILIWLGELQQEIIGIQDQGFKMMQLDLR